jgi:hypothetical protein
MTTHTIPRHAELDSATQHLKNIKQSGITSTEIPSQARNDNKKHHVMQYSIQHSNNSKNNFKPGILLLSCVVLFIREG